MVVHINNFIARYIALAIIVVGFTMCLPFGLFVNWYLTSIYYTPPPDANINVMIWLRMHANVNNTTYLIREYMPYAGFLLFIFGIAIHKRVNPHK